MRSGPKPLSMARLSSAKLAAFAIFAASAVPGVGAGQSPEDAVLRGIESTDPGVCLAAVRQSPDLPAPELALPQLASLSGGRDPLLAPAAALASLRIARALSADEVRMREAVDPGALLNESERWETLSRKARVRADLQRTAALVHLELSELQSHPSE